MDAIPFTAKTGELDASVYRETVYEGLLRLEDQALVLEFGERVTEIGEGVVDQQGTGVHEVRIPVGAVRELSYRHRWIRPSLLDIELARLGPPRRCPGSEAPGSGSACRVLRGRAPGSSAPRSSSCRPTPD